ncbi:Crp/Fnr family transcriptional regulator [Merismopedia glauca]|uniref:Cyclic nucleotide-binding protein n=1 Tax=Merismopedia glauca CCAP 1448/3 TaxID=1296344 RepID=A0A2T1BYE6_9CYAN|nr:Crp/Fnr family transcriptional regulator [Merismopedia glauca]PSB01056.1 cyclic nucleotide-binding protein [Merismopedia glauca CCAP 1448/3]
MQATLEHLKQVYLLAALQDAELEQIQAYAWIKTFSQGEIVMHEGDRLPSRLFTLASGSVRITRTATTGKETIFRVLSTGEMFAAPALFGNGIAPATVTAEVDCEVVMVEREALMNAIRSNPEIAFKMLGIFNQRLQQLHDTVHGLISERAIARLARYIHDAANEHGTVTTPEGAVLRSRLSYYQIARSIGITYEECVRLFKQIQGVVSYSRGGKITLKDGKMLEAIAMGVSREITFLGYIPE